MSIIESFPAFLLVFVRITAFYVTVPLFSYRTIPAVHKIGFAFFLALVSFQAIEKPPQLDVDGVYMMLAMKEALIGLLLGLIAYMMISAVQIAGSFIDFQMGFAVANVIDPQTGAQSPLVGQFLYTMALLLMLSLNAHHLLLDGIYYSYQYIPVDKMALSFGSEGFAEFIAKSFNTMFITAFQLSAPVVACLFLVDLALG
ncbi:flagellar biosynthetic protein FliR, partial [Bacillus paralicheniformis]